MLACDARGSVNPSLTSPVEGFGYAGWKQNCVGGGGGATSAIPLACPPPRHPQSFGSVTPMIVPCGSVDVIPSKRPRTQLGRLRQGAAPTRVIRARGATTSTVRKRAMRSSLLHSQDSPRARSSLSSRLLHGIRRVERAPGQILAVVARAAHSHAFIHDLYDSPVRKWPRLSDSNISLADTLPPSTKM